MNEVPEHYRGPDGRTCADVIRDVLGSQMGAFWHGNALKYIYRAGRKGGAAGYEADIRKAIDCLERLLAEHLGNGEGGSNE
jgi:hypothetical protein